MISFFSDFAAFIELVHSSNGTTKWGTEYDGKQDSKSKRMKSSKRGEKKNMSVVPCHLIQTDVSSVKGGSSIFSNMMFCILKGVLRVTWVLSLLTDCWNFFLWCCVLENISFYIFCCNFYVNLNVLVYFFHTAFIQMLVEF